MTDNLRVFILQHFLLWDQLDAIEYIDGYSGELVALIIDFLNK
jgi:hypothetical protein